MTDTIPLEDARQLGVSATISGIVLTLGYTAGEMVGQFWPDDFTGIKFHPEPDIYISEIRKAIGNLRAFADDVEDGLLAAEQEIEA